MSVELGGVWPFFPGEVITGPMIQPRLALASDDVEIAVASGSPPALQSQYPLVLGP